MWFACNLANCQARSDNAVAIEQLLTEAKTVYRKDFNAAYGRIVVQARQGKVLDCFQILLNSIRTEIAQMERWINTPVLYHPQKTDGVNSSNLVLDARDRICAALEEMDRLRPLLRHQLGPATENDRSTSRPLTRKQCQIWDSLEGLALTGREIAVKVDSDEISVRKQIQEIRKSGLNIKNKRGLGYYRLDFPPNELTSNPA